MAATRRMMSNTVTATAKGSLFFIIDDSEEEYAGTEMFLKTRPVIQSLDLSQLNEIHSQRGDVSREAKVRQRSNNGSHSKVGERAQAVNLQSKQIWVATMKDDVDKVDQLRQEVAKMAEEKKHAAYMQPS
jgi:hypothetical protein